MLFTPNELYAPVFLEDYYVCDIRGGRARGGSHFITDYFLFKITQFEYFRGYFMRYIQGDIRKSLFQDFLDRIEENPDIDESLFNINETRLEIEYVPTGNKILSKGFKKSSGSQTANLKSIAGATDVIIEECEEISEDDFNKLQDSIRTNKSDIHIYRIWNPPPKDHWLIKNYYDLEPSEYEGFYYAYPKGVNGHLDIVGTYHDNIQNVNERTVLNFESYKETNLSHYCSDILGLISGGVKGQIFKDWKLYKDLPEDTIFYKVYGVDWGGNDPNTFIELNFDKKRKRVFIKQHLYDSNILNSDMARLVKKTNTDNKEVVCDSARKDRIREFINIGINAFKANKTKISNDFRADVCYMLMEFDIFIQEDSKETIDEFVKFSWAYNHATKEPLNVPEDKNNHSIDACLYATRYYYNNFSHLYNSHATE